MDAVLASGNAGKLREFAQLFADLDWRLQAQSEFAVPAIAETGTTFVENAIIKARHAALYAARPALADDSGLMVDALDGAPGVYSARYAGVQASDHDNLCKLLDATRDLDDHARGCRFICVLVFMRAAEDPLPLIATGVWNGQLLRAPRGANGFGYDPIFFAPDQGCAAAELPSATKNVVSHRGQAMRALRAALQATAR